MAELAYALDLGSNPLTGLRVQLPSLAYLRVLNVLNVLNVSNVRNVNHNSSSKKPDKY